jgi:hypothetical protein
MRVIKKIINMKMNTKNRNKKQSLIFILTIVGILGVFLISFVSAADPGGPDIVNITSNTTRTSIGAGTVNISGGYVASMNLSATIQDIRWKAFVGHVTGLFTLQDSSGSTIYDWRLSSITGRVYTTRNFTTLNWVNINCSNITTLNQENINMNHTNANDNLNMTFNTTAGATHNSFYVGSKYISNSTCPTLNTYVNNATQDNYFEEMALYEGTSMVYATILNQNRAGYNGQNYDFQMIVPENGASSFQGSTAYYLYVEIS